MGHARADLVHLESIPPGAIGALANFAEHMFYTFQAEARLVGGGCPCCHTRRRAMRVCTSGLVLAAHSGSSTASSGAARGDGRMHARE